MTYVGRDTEYLTVGYLLFLHFSLFLIHTQQIPERISVRPHGFGYKKPWANKINKE